MLFLFVCIVAIFPNHIFIYLHCRNIPKGYSSNSSEISDYVNIVEVTLTQHYTRIAYNRFPKQKMLENDRMETASTEVMSIWRQNDTEKPTWRTHRYFVDFESRTHSSNINEVTRAILNSFIQKRHNHKQAQTGYERTKIKTAPKQHLRRKIATYSLIWVFVLLPECLCVV